MPVHESITTDRMPRAIWALGLVSLFMDVSSEMIHSLLPAFIVTALGASAMSLGVIEGVAESTALIVKVFSGTLSDYLGRRKWLAVAGYGLGALSKPLFALAPGVGAVFFARFIDRIGKGVRGAPRDALVADLTPPSIRGAAYGLRQALDTIGAFAGPLLAVGLMLLWHDDFRAVFWVAVIPGALAVLMLVLGVRESERAAAPRRAVWPLQRRELARLDRRFWWVVLAGTTFAIARFSEAFLVLRAAQTGLALAWLPATLVVMNAVYALTAYPFGRLADRRRRDRLLGAGLVVLIAADGVLAAAHHWSLVLAGVALWGLHMGITQGLLATMVAAASPENLRGTAFGVFNLASGLSMLAASVLAGFLWDTVGPSAPFLASGAACVLALVLVVSSPDGVATGRSLPQ